MSRRRQEPRLEDAKQLIFSSYAGLEGLIEIMEQNGGRGLVHLDSVVALLKPLSEKLGDAWEIIGE